MLFDPSVPTVVKGPNMTAPEPQPERSETGTISAHGVSRG
jgi:hypothetical protein